MNGRSSHDSDSSNRGAPSIRGVACDFDGVITDNAFFWDSHGLELKRFCFADVTGINRAKGSGLVIALISGESSDDGMRLVRRYAAKLQLENVYAGVHDKADALRHFASANGLALSEVCYIGDDIIDSPAISIAGLSAAPASAHSSVRQQVDYVCRASGGDGALREVLDYLLGVE